MFIPVIKGKTPKQTAEDKGIDMATLFPKLSELDADEQSIVIFLSDPVNNPIISLENDDKESVLCAYFGFDKKIVRNIIGKIHTNGNKYYDACCEINFYIARPIELTAETLSRVMTQTSMQIGSVNYSEDIGDKDDKQFERLTKWQEQSLKNAERLKGFEPLMRSAEEAELFKKMKVEYRSRFDGESKK